MSGGHAVGTAEERVDLSPSSPSWAEHRSRYHFAAEHVDGRLVVDVACGTGFGAAILQEAGAAAVWGIDTSETALARARKWAAERTGLCRADCVSLPLATGTVPVVVSFETIEHLHEPERFVGELRRVLAPSGILILSTPNALHTKPVGGKPANPYHVREFTPDELLSLLESEFADVRLLGQRPGPHYPVCPYWTIPEHLPTDPVGRLRVLAWKARNRLPGAVNERLSRSLHGRGFFPGEHDFAFTEAAVPTGHVLVAVCRP